MMKLLFIPKDGNFIWNENAFILDIKIVQYLKKGERCVCEIAPYLREEQSNVSRHLVALKRVGILSCRKEGVSVYCKIEDENIYKIFDLALSSVKKTARGKVAILS